MIGGIFVAAMLAAGAPNAPRLPARLPPVDRCTTDASFTAFRTQLRRAIARRDHAFLLSIVAPDIEFSFGGEAGRTAFIHNWNLDTSPATSEIWTMLGEALRLGCAPDEDRHFWSPSLFVFAGALDDPYGVALAVRRGAALHAAPNAASPVVVTLDWDLLRVANWDDQAQWQQARTAGGRSGYALTADLRSPIDFRAEFRRVRGHWRMTSFVSGD